MCGSSHGALKFERKSDNFLCHRNHIELILLVASWQKELPLSFISTAMSAVATCIHPFRVVPGFVEHFSSPFDPLQLLVLLWLVIEDHDNLFIMAESVHFLGIGLLIYKLMTKKNAGGGSSFLLPCHLTWRMPARSAIQSVRHMLIAGAHPNGVAAVSS